MGQGLADDATLLDRFQAWRHLLSLAEWPWNKTTTTLGCDSNMKLLSGSHSQHFFPRHSSSVADLGLEKLTSEG